MLTTNMFIVGGASFLVYISGLLYMINWAHKTQKEDMIADSRKIDQNKNKQ